MTYGGEAREGERIFLDGVVAWLLGVGGSETLARMDAHDPPLEAERPFEDGGASDELAS